MLILFWCTDADFKSVVFPTIQKNKLPPFSTPKCVGWECLKISHAAHFRSFQNPKAAVFFVQFQGNLCSLLATHNYFAVIISEGDPRRAI